MSTGTLIKKIAPRSVAGDKKFIAGLVEEGKPAVPLFRVIGLCHSYRSGEHPQNGIWHGLVGQFKAENLITKEVFRAGECFLPDVISNLYMSNLLRALEENEGSTMQIACEILVQYSDIGVGYEYVVKPLIEQDEANDPLAAIEASLNLPKLSEGVGASSPEKSSESATATLEKPGEKKKSGFFGNKG